MLEIMLEILLGNTTSIPIGFEYDLLTMRPFFQDRGVKRRNSGAITRLCNADIDKMGSSKWGTLKCAGYNRIP